MKFTENPPQLRSRDRVTRFASARRFPLSKLSTMSQGYTYYTGFSLAEVLITLGIIGVVAALTIATVLQNYQERQYVGLFKENYSVLSQAYVQAAQEYGTADNWTNGTDAPNYLKDYLKTTKVIDLSVQYPWFTNGDCKTLDGSYGGEYRYQLVLANGANLRFILDGNCWVIQMDVNGLKPPNQYGYDIFFVTLGVKNGAPIVSYAYYPDPWAISNSDYCRKSVTSGWGRGVSCAWWLMRHDDMRYLHEDISNEDWVK